MKNLSRTFFVVIAFGLSACASGPKRLAQLERAVQQPTEVAKLCDQGLSGACALAGRPTTPPKLMAIMQGVTSPTQSRFAVLVPKNQKFRYFSRSLEGRIQPLEARRVERPSSPMAIDQVEAFHLELRDAYELIVIDGGGELADRREFKALDLNKKRPRLAVVSCMDDSLKAEQLEMWKLVPDYKPDAILMIGDNVYADRIPGGWALANAEQLWDRYVDTRSLLEVFKYPVLVPVFATWDDHDYGRNDSDRTYPLKEESARVFHAFFPQDKPTDGFERGPGVASWWRAFGAQWALLDDRSFRTPNKSDSADQTHFGAEQEDWIRAQLKDRKEPTFLISGDQFFGAYHAFESFEGSHPRNFAAQLASWKKYPAPIVFVSGDRHLTEIIRVPKASLGYPTFELTSSAMHAKVFADAFNRHPSPNQLVGKAGEYNFMLVDVVAVSSKRLELDVQSVGRGHQVLFKKNLKVVRK